MQNYAYEMDDELRFIENESGYKIDHARRVKAPAEALRNHLQDRAELKKRIQMHLAEFEQEADTQEVEINRTIQHGQFFLKEFRSREWAGNPMFDRLRLRYISQVDGLKRERRQLRKDVILKRMATEEKLLQAMKDLSPLGTGI